MTTTTITVPRALLCNNCVRKRGLLAPWPEPFVPSSSQDSKTVKHMSPLTVTSGTVTVYDVAVVGSYWTMARLVLEQGFALIVGSHTTMFLVDSVAVGTTFRNGTIVTSAGGHRLLDPLDLTRAHPHGVSLDEIPEGSCLDCGCLLYKKKSPIALPSP